MKHSMKLAAAALMSIAPTFAKAQQTDLTVHTTGGVFECVENGRARAEAVNEPVNVTCLTHHKNGDTVFYPLLCVPPTRDTKSTCGRVGPVVAIFPNGTTQIIPERLLP